jgi:ABC-2 type transport system permease protein
MRPVLAILLRQFYLLRGSPTRVIPLFAWVAIDIVLWGFISRYLNSVSGARFNFVPALLGAVLLWDFMARVMQGITTAFLEDVWSRNFLNLFASPLSVTEYLTGLVLCSIGTSAVGLAVMVVLATAVFGLSFFIFGVQLAAFVLVLFLFGIALGIFGSALVLRFGPPAEWFIWPIPAFLSPFACVFYPLATLPAWMRIFARFIPASYVFEGLRAVLAHRSANEAPLLMGCILSLAYLLLMIGVFTRIYRRAVRTGLIARYSAESIS